MANLVLAFGELMAGGIILDAAIKGDSVSNVVRGVATQQTLAGSTVNSSSSTAGALPAATTATGGYVPPVNPSVAKLGRTDQGVDITAPPGTPVRSIGPARVVGIIKNWWQGQPLVWTQLLSGPQRGRFVYYAEQINPSVQVGQTLNAGDPIGTVAPSGTGLELGYATASGQTLARATTGYTEGQQTTAGQEFRQLLGRLGL